jgi:alginate O-acetyltransferase complex protein AlgI
MNFNTFEFLLVFLPVCLALFYTVPVSCRLLILLIFSLIFYGYSGIVPLELLLITIIWAYSLTFISSKRYKKSIFLITVSFPLIALWLFKYLNFTFSLLPDYINDIKDPFFLFFLKVSIPAGISFYTFQLLSYVIDVYDGSIQKEKNFVKFATYISSFPQLIAGPIVRYKDMVSQLSLIATQPKLNPDFASGIKFLVFGIFAKTFFSDALFLFHAKFNLSNPSTSLDAVYSVISYSFIIYYDFWAYSLMAIGLGKLFAINLPRNFLEPYLSTSPREFWKRWHVTLSYWIRDYVYIRLGGNKAYKRNIFVVFLAVGLWHGAGMNFICWGIYHAILVVVFHYTQFSWNKLPKASQILLTYCLISLGWPLFYLDLESYFKLIKSIISIESTLPSVYSMFNWIYLFVIAIWTFGVRENRWLFNQKSNNFFDNPILQSFIFVLCLMFFSYRRTFIYFQF